MYKKSLTKEQALQKLRHYCDYQERCHQDVRDKMYELRVPKKDHDELLVALIEEDRLNEERFAIAFAGGKWRLKQWGRIKIRYELKQRQVSDHCIKKAFEQIDENEYVSVLQKLAAEKYDSLETEPGHIRKKKTMDYLLQKGFESGLILEVLKSPSQ